MSNSWLDWLAIVALIGVVILGLLAWWGSRSRFRTSIEGISYETVLIAATISPFVTAFATKLGERLGTTVKVERMSWRQRRRQRAELVVARPFRRITLEVGAGLSDEARLALIELDVEQPELWGHLLRWDDEAKAWLPVPNVPDGEDAV
ncbi:hypothetical protein [Streptomyces sp. NPDC056453]|uniref:hypothetical protein n=1 Tax=Streptomyces sp. NPDC056453 TaxID=3345822 RepID=UPI0036C2D54B